MPACSSDCTGNTLSVSRSWLLLTAFVGANLLQVGCTSFCPIALVLKKTGLPASG